jgi:hypothetical protein
MLLVATWKQASLREIVDVDIGVESSVLLRELGAIHRCDAALIVSDFERHMLIHKVSCVRL